MHEQLESYRPSTTVDMLQLFDGNNGALWSQIESINRQLRTLLPIDEDHPQEQLDRAQAISEEFVHAFFYSLIERPATCQHLSIEESEQEEADLVQGIENIHGTFARIAYGHVLNHAGQPSPTSLIVVFNVQSPNSGPIETAALLSRDTLIGFTVEREVAPEPNAPLLETLRYHNNCLRHFMHTAWFAKLSPEDRLNLVDQVVSQLYNTHSTLQEVATEGGIIDWLGPDNLPCHAQVSDFVVVPGDLDNSAPDVYNPLADSAGLYVHATLAYDEKAVLRIPVEDLASIELDDGLLLQTMHMLADEVRALTSSPKFLAESNSKKQAIDNIMAKYTPVLDSLLANTSDSPLYCQSPSRCEVPLGHLHGSIEELVENSRVRPNQWPLDITHATKSFVIPELHDTEHTTLQTADDFVVSEGELMLRLTFDKTDIVSYIPVRALTRFGRL